MPKDKTENIDRYKVRGGQFNDYQIKQDELAWVQDDQDRTGGRLREGGWPEPPVEDEAARIQRMMEEAREKAERKKAKLLAKGAAGKGAAKKGAGKAGAKSGAKKAAAKKSGAKKSGAKKAAGKAAGKGAAKKSAAKKGGVQKAGAKKAGAKKSVAKKGAAKKSTKARGWSPPVARGGCIVDARRLCRREDSRRKWGRESV